MTTYEANEPGSTGTGTDDLLPTRRSLLGRLQNWEDQRSWQEFFDTYWRLIYQVARRAGLRETEAQDVVQETMLSAAKKMKDFQYDPALGSFKGWLLQLTGWRIANQFKKRAILRGSGSAVEQGASSSCAVEALPDSHACLNLERVWEEEWQQNLMQAAMERIRCKVNPKHFQIFELSVLKQKPVAEIKKFLGVSAMEIYLARHRLTKLLQREIERLRSELV